jgi:RNA polymerase sigma-70 factor (ECF subfamily)
LRLRDPRDEGAWREFLELYAPLVYGYARKQGLQDADAADLSQEVLCAVAGAIDRLDYDVSRGKFRNWLFTIVRRKLSSWRAARRNRVLGSGDLVTQQLLQQQPIVEEAETEWEAQWQRCLFAWACTQVRGEVKEETWQAFWRTAVDGQTCKRAAHDLGLSLGAVYHARSRILSRLREQIQSIREP